MTAFADFVGWVALKEFQEVKHPRHGKGDPAGGEFAPKEWQSQVPTEVQAQAPDMAARARQYAGNIEKFLGTPTYDASAFANVKWPTDSGDFEKPDVPFANAAQELRQRGRYLNHFADEVDTHDAVRASVAHGMLHPDDIRDLQGFDKAHEFFTKTRGMMKPAAVAVAQKETGMALPRWYTLGTREKSVHTWWTAMRHKAFDESEHPRGPKGSHEGGKFVPKSGGAPIDAGSTSEYPWVKKALARPIVDLGQLGHDAKNQLEQAVKAGVLKKGKGGGFPTPKTVYAHPSFDIEGDHQAKQGDLKAAAMRDAQKRGEDVTSSPEPGKKRISEEKFNDIYHDMQVDGTTTEATEELAARAKKNGFVDVEPAWLKVAQYGKENPTTQEMFDAHIARVHKKRAKADAERGLPPYTPAQDPMPAAIAEAMRKQHQKN